MPTLFCSTCAAKVTYEAIKPSSCPKCSTAILDPLAMMAKAVASAGAPPAPVSPPPYRPTVIVGGTRAPQVPYEEAPPPVARSERSRPAHRTQADDGPVRPFQPMYEGEQPGDRTPHEDHYDRHEAKRLARQLVASIDPSTISVGMDEGDGDDRVSLGSLFPEAIKRGRRS